MEYAPLGTSGLKVSRIALGPTKPHHLADAAAALDVHLTAEEIVELEEPYTVRMPTGY